MEGSCLQLHHSASHRFIWPHYYHKIVTSALARPRPPYGRWSPAQGYPFRRVLSSITRLVELADPNCAIKTSSSVTWRVSTSLHSHGKHLLPIATDGVPLWVLVIHCQPHTTQKNWEARSSSSTTTGRATMSWGVVKVFCSSHCWLCANTYSVMCYPLWLCIFVFLYYSVMLKVARRPWAPRKLSLNLLSKLVLSLILEKHLVVLEYFPASLKILE